MRVCGDCGGWLRRERNAQSWNRWGGVYSVNGKIQKGPFTQGTSITIQALDENLNPTGKNYHTQTVDDAGSFHINNQIESRYVEIIASGYYFNEITGQISTSPITLRSLSNLTEEGKTNVNLLTTLEAERIRTLVLHGGNSMHEARRQAELELFDLFHIPDNRNVSYVFDKMDITKDGESNAILLAISATLQVGRSEGALSELISKIASEIAESGSVGNENIREQIRENGMLVDAVSVRKNLEDRYTSLGIGDYVIPPFEDYLDINGNGVIDKNDSWLILNKTDFRLSSDGGTIEIEVQHNVDFEVIVEDDDFENDWVIQSDQTKAYLETDHLTFTVLPNGTYDDRVARIILRDKSSGCEDAVYVFQKQLDALTVSSSRFEVPTGGGRVEIEVQSNVNYTVEIQNDCRSWIKEVPATKSLSSSVLVFDIAENFETGMRHGRIVVSDGNLSETIDVYQSGGNRIILDKKDHTVSAKGGVVQIEVSSNFDYEMILPEVDWVSEIMQTKGLATGTRTFRIAPNETYDDRYAEIIFRDRNGTVEEKATIWQVQKDAIIIARDEYEIGNEGGDITIEIQANVDFKTRVANYCQSWIEPVPMTKGLTDYSFRFKVLPHEDYDGRSGEIYIYNNDTEKYIRVVQGPKKALEISTKEYNLPATGGLLRIGLNTNLICHCVYTDPEAEAWLVRVPETKGMQFVTFDFNASPNDTYSSRRTQLVIESEDGSCRETVTVTQDPKGALNVGQTEYNVPYMAGELAIEVESSIDYVSEVIEGSEWLSLAPASKALEMSSVKFAFTKNDTYVERVGKVKIYDTKNSLESIVTIIQAPNGDTRVIHVETPGTLADIVDFEELKNVRSLKLTGTVNESDLGHFRVNGSFLTETLDLTELNVIGGKLNTFGRVTSVLGGAIGYFGKLKTVYMSPTVKTLGPDAFSACDSLENIIFGENSQLTSIEGGSESYALGGVIIKGAFSRCSSLKSVTLPASLKRLHGGAFYKCENLESVTFEEGSKMTTIQGDVYSAGGMGGTSYYDYAGIFSHCPSLRKLEIPASVETIGDYAFCGTNGLVSIVIPETVKYVSSLRMFSDCTSLESVSLPSSFKEFGYEMFSGCPNLKEVRTASDIEKIGDYAFRGCTSITEIDLGNFSSVGVGAFSESGLTSVHIPDAMKELPEDLFRKCTGLKNVDLNKVEGIGSGAFVQCNSLESIVIPKTIKFIGSYAFSGCENLKEFTLSGGDRITFESCILSGTKVRELVIPAEVVSIVSAAKNYDGGSLSGSEIYSIVFEDNSKCEEFGIAGGSKITSIVLPSGLKRLAGYALRNCKNLTDIILPDNLQTIGESAFRYCSSLSEIEIPSSVDTLEQECFYGTPLESVIIPEGVKYIGFDAFACCPELTTVTLPNTLECICMGAFANCTSLKPFVINGAETLECKGSIFKLDGSTAISPYISKIVFGKNIKKLKSNTWAFNPPVNVEFEEGSALEEIGDKFFKGYDFSSIVLPSTVKKIGADAFANSKITEFTCPESLESLGRYAFSNSALTRITLNEGLKSMGSDVFAGCAGLQSLTLQSDLTSIGSGCFSGCISLEAVAISEGVTSLPSGMFKAFTSLRNLSLPSTLTSIGSDCFSGCTGIMELKLPSSLTSIGNRAFSGCTGLQSLTLPSSLTSIGGGAFYNCTGLQSLTLQSDLTSASDCFSGCNALESVTISEGVTTLPSYIFKNCTGLREVTLPKSLTSMGSNAFSGCEALETVVIPESVTTIGNGAFENTSPHIIWNTSSNDISAYGSFNGCTGRMDIGGYGVPYRFYEDVLSKSSLSEFNLLDGIKVIGSYAFEFMTETVTFTIPESVVNIQANAFYGCTFAGNIDLPSSLETIGSNAFAFCTGLTELILPASVKAIYKSAFTGTAIKEVRCKSLVPPELSTNPSWLPFDKTNQPAIFVPAAALDAYKAATGWKEYELQGY